MVDFSKIKLNSEFGEKKPVVEKPEFEEVSNVQEEVQSVLSIPVNVVPGVKVESVVDDGFDDVLQDLLSGDDEDFVVPAPPNVSSVPSVVEEVSAGPDTDVSSVKPSVSFGRGSRKVSGVELDFWRSVSVVARAKDEGFVHGVRGAVSHVGGLKDPDLELVRFLAKFKYSSSGQLGSVIGVREQAVTNRLNKLRSYGLVERLSLGGARPTWFLTRGGMLVSGFDLPVVREASLSYLLVPHQFAVTNTAGNLWGGGVNVLNLDEWPVRNRVNVRGELAFGEELVSETQLLSSFGKFKRLEKAEVFRPKILNSIESAFAAWEPGFVSPEFEDGNEYMWVLFPPGRFGTNYHVPDLVVARERNADGSPESIAVEVELDPKMIERYRTTMIGYREDRRLYKKVIWVCKSLTVSNLVERAARDTGLWQEGRIDIVPILTERGVYTGKDLWRL